MYDIFIGEGSLPGEKCKGALNPNGEAESYEEEEVPNGDQRGIEEERNAQKNKE